jgi:uncharacterized membrane protein
MYKNCLAYILFSLIFLVVLDLGFMNLNWNMYSLQVIDVQRVQIVPRLGGMIGAYFFMILGLYWFILRNRRPVWEAIILGLVIYGVFDWTSYGLFKKWHLKTAVVDTLWGGAVFGLTTAFVYQLVPK